MSVRFLLGIHFSSVADKKTYESIVSLVDLIMKLQKKKYENSGEKLLTENITEAIKKIDQLVYELYDFYKEDISIIEEQFK